MRQSLKVGIWLRQWQLENAAYRVFKRFLLRSERFTEIYVAGRCKERWWWHSAQSLAHRKGCAAYADHKFSELPPWPSELPSAPDCPGRAPVRRAITMAPEQEPRECQVVQNLGQQVSVACTTSVKRPRDLKNVTNLDVRTGSRSIVPERPQPFVTALHERIVTALRRLVHGRHDFVNPSVSISFFSDGFHPGWFLSRNFQSLEVVRDVYQDTETCRRYYWTPTYRRNEKIRFDIPGIRYTSRKRTR